VRIALAGSGLLALAGRFVVAGHQAGPGGQAGAAGKARHVAAGLGHDHLRDARPDPRDRHQAGDDRIERLGGPLDQLVQDGDLAGEQVVGVEMDPA